MGIDKILKKWLEIEFYHMANRLGFIDSDLKSDYSLLLDTIRSIDSSTSKVGIVDTNIIIALLSLMWEHIDRKKYDLKDFIIKISSRIGYPTSAIISDSNYNSQLCQFSSITSIRQNI